MTYGSILVPIDEHPPRPAASRPRSAWRAPSAPPGRPRDHPAARGSPEVAAETERRGDHEEGVRARQGGGRAGIRRFEAQAKKAGVASVEGLAIEAEAEAILSLRARTADLVVLPRPARTTSASWAGTPSRPRSCRVGRPVLLVPEKGLPAGFPKKCWWPGTASREAARALSDSVPLLARAKSVIVFSSARGRRGSAAWRGRRPCAISRGTGSPRRRCTHGRRRARRPHDPRAREEDRRRLLVMGAYGRPRFAELVLAARRGPSCAGGYGVLMSH